VEVEQGLGDWDGKDQMDVQLVITASRPPSADHVDEDDALFTTDLHVTLIEQRFWDIKIKGVTLRRSLFSSSPPVPIREELALADVTDVGRHEERTEVAMVAAMLCVHESVKDVATDHDPVMDIRPRTWKWHPPDNDDEMDYQEVADVKDKFVGSRKNPDEVNYPAMPKKCTAQIGKKKQSCAKTQLFIVKEEISSCGQKRKHVYQVKKQFLVTIQVVSKTSYFSKKHRVDVSVTPRSADQAATTGVQSSQTQ
jgi:hypothetical protein